MGFFQDFGDFFTKSIPNFFTKTVPHAVSSVFNEVKSIGGGILGGVKDTIDKAVGGTQKTIQGVVSTAEKVITTGENVIGKTVTSVGQSLSFPLILLGGAAGLYFLTAKR